MKAAKYALGLDFGTNSVRALVVDVANGNEVGTAIFAYPSGSAGILLDPKDAEPGPPEPGRLDPGHRAGRARGPGRGEKEGQGLRSRLGHRHRRRHDRLDAAPRRPGRHAAGPLQGVQEEPQRPWPGCGRTTPATPRPPRSRPWPPRERPEYLAKCGGTYSSEWFWSKILHCLRDGPQGRLGRPLLGRVRRLHPRPAHRRSPTRYT